MSSSLVGRSLGNYKVVDTLGHGGMAAVYVAYQEAVDRKVAIKVLSTALGSNPQFVERFQLEARTIARLQHPHILPLYDYGQQEDILYLVMAYVDGGTIEDVLDGGPLSLGRVEKILREIAGALDYAHRQGVIHRDIKPANILLDSEGHALLADFGIVKLSEGKGNLTGTGVVGTPAYMAPEQAQGLQLDKRADIYSLGVVVYEMLTGRQPFTGDTMMQVMIKVMQEPPPNIEDVTQGLPAGISAVMHKVLSKDPTERYQTATEFADAFSKVVSSSSQSLVAKPLETDDDDRTRRFGPGTLSNMSTQQRVINDSQPIIVQQGISPNVLLGGLLIVALAIIVAVVAILSLNGDDSDPGTGQTGQATNVAVATDEPEPENTVAPTATATTPAVVIPTFGQVGFSSVNSTGDTLNLRAENMPPITNSQLVVWLVNSSDDSVLNVGNLALDPLGAGSLSYTDADSRMLPALFNQVRITREDGAVDAPTGEVLFSGSVPEEVMTAMREIFVASEQGLNGGSLLAGLRTEASTAAQHAGLAANSSNIGGLHTHAEHSINILRGELVDYNGNGRGENPGRGIGVYFFLNRMDELLQAGVDASDTPDLGINMEPMRICIQNSVQRAETLEALERELLTLQDIAVAQPQREESTVVASALIAGEDLNDSGAVDPFEGECGIDQIQVYGVLASRLTLFEAE